MAAARAFTGGKMWGGASEGKTMGLNFWRKEGAKGQRCGRTGYRPTFILKVGLFRP